MRELGVEEFRVEGFGLVEVASRSRTVVVFNRVEV